MNEIKLGRAAGLQFSAMPTAIASFVVIWIILAIVGIVILGLSPLKAILGGLLAALLHWLSETIHQLGHAWAARRSGHPMLGVRFWGPLSASVYPADEPPLPAAIHIRRALGGPIASAMVTIIAGIVLLLLSSRGGTPGWLALFFFLDNLLVFTLGAFLPLGFTDGSTLLAWRGKP